MPNLLVPHRVLRLSRTEVPSLRQRYPASAVLRTSPPPKGARPVPRGPPVGRPRPHLGASRVACAFLVYMLLPLPRCSAWTYSSLIHPDISAFPERVVGSACTSSFSRLARHSLALRPAHSRCHQCVTRYTEGFSHFVTSMTAPVASGWSDAGQKPRRSVRNRTADLHTHYRFYQTGQKYCSVSDRRKCWLPCSRTGCPRPCRRSAAGEDSRCPPDCKK